MPLRPRSPIVAACIAAAVAVAAAQSRRAPTADEATVLTRFIDAIAAAVDRFADQNWEVRGGTFPRDASHESIAMHARVPLDDCIGGDRTWAVRQNSPLFNARLQPLYDRVKTLGDAMAAAYRSGQNASATVKELEGIRQQIKGINQVTMTVCGNSPSVEAAALAQDAPSLLSGVAVHKIPPPTCTDAPACYVLVYGDWKTARRSGDRLLFHFVHPAASPYLENIVIRLTGADDRIQQMLKSADWTKIDSALGGP